jgi:hypothetical protein
VPGPTATVLKHRRQEGPKMVESVISVGMVVGIVAVSCIALTLAAIAAGIVDG